MKLTARLREGLILQYLGRRVLLLPAVIIALAIAMGLAVGKRLGFIDRI